MVSSMKGTNKVCGSCRDRVIWCGHCWKRAQEYVVIVGPDNLIVAGQGEVK